MNKGNFGLPYALAVDIMLHYCTVVDNCHVVMLTGKSALGISSFSRPCMCVSSYALRSPAERENLQVHWYICCNGNSLIILMKFNYYNFCK